MSAQDSGLTHRLQFGLFRRMPMLMGSEAAECGLACVGMIASFYGHAIDLRKLRSRHQVSLRGLNLTHLIRIAQSVGLNSRPVKLDLDELRDLRLPCILHWNFNHFVVLKAVGRDSIRINDPAVGERTISWPRVSDSFTGVALELWPSADFQPAAKRPSVNLRQLLGPMTGLRRSLGQILAIALALEVFTVIQPLFIHWVIDNAIVSADRSLLTTLAVGFGLVAVIAIAIRVARSWLSMYVAMSLGLQLQANVFAHLLRLPTRFFEHRFIGDITSRFQGVNSIQTALTTSLVLGILDGLMALVTLTALLLYSPVLASLVVVAVALSTLLTVAWNGARLRATEEQAVHAAKQSGHFLESIRGIKAIKLFGREADRNAAWLGFLVNQINASIRLQNIQTGIEASRGLVLAAEYILLVWLGASMVLDGAFTVGALMAVYSYKLQFEARFNGFVDRAIQLRMLKVPLERLSDIVLTEPEESPTNDTLGEHEPLVAEIDVRGLRFRYSDQEPFVLDGATFRIAAGESVAIVGASAAGKTTLLNLLLGIYTPHEGEVRIGGHEIDKLGLGRLRNMIGTVLQDDTLFAGSISDNISFFDPNPDQSWIEECARQVGIHAEIMQLPMRYQTLLGDLGTSFSGGQKQCLLVARALYKKPGILVLDEATSHLDVQRERSIADAIRKLSLTRIIVAHRPETIASADRILLLQSGTIQEVRNRGVAEIRPGGKQL